MGDAPEQVYIGLRGVNLHKADRGDVEYVRADTRPAVTLAEALAVAALVARMEKITKHEYASRDQLVLDCDLGQITLGDIADLCAALDQIKRAV